MERYPTVTTTQFSIRDVVRVIKRRKKLLLIPPILVTIACTVGAFQIERMYESSMNLLVQRSAARNPFSSFLPMSENPLRTLDEIIFSVRTLERLADSLGYNLASKDELSRRMIITRLRKSLGTKHGSEGESITISYLDSDPKRAQLAVIMAAEIFIEIASGLKDDQNELMVDFYQKKLNEFRRKLEDSQEKILPALSERIQKNTAVSLSISNIDQQIRDAEKGLRKFQDQEKMMSGFRQQDVESKEGRQILYELQRSEVPYASNLGILLNQYSDLLSRYTAKHPDAEKAASQIVELLERIKAAIRKETLALNTLLNKARNQRVDIVDEMVRLSLMEQKEKEKEADYSLYQKLYTEMKVKLEEAEVSRSLSQNTDYKFIILDPAYLPLFPSKPSRTLIVGGGFVAGVLIGIILTVVAELTDTRIRFVRQISVFQKPVIGLLPRGKHSR